MWELVEHGVGEQAYIGVGAKEQVKGDNKEVFVDLGDVGEERQGLGEERTEGR